MTSSLHYPVCIFFQAEDGIRDADVTGVQTCALPIPPRSTLFPFGDVLRVAVREIPLEAVTLNVGILYVFAMLSLGVYGVMMAGWSSANNFALLGGQRAAALMISAEIAIGASIMGVVMIYGSLNMMDIVRAQGRLFWGWLPAWGIVTQPLAFVLFLTAGIAAPKRIPFVTPEGGAPIIGYFFQYIRVKRRVVAHADI